jgi:hypothetical protein
MGYARFGVRIKPNQTKPNLNFTRSFSAVYFTALQHYAILISYVIIHLKW